MKFSVGPADAPYIARALTVSDHEILLATDEADVIDRRLRLTLHAVAGVPWPGEGADRNTAPYVVPAAIAIKLARAQMDASEPTKEMVEDAVASIVRNFDGSGQIVIGGKRFELRAATVKEFAAAYAAARNNGQLAGLKLLRHTLVSVDGKPPVEAPHSLAYYWPFDLPTTKMLQDFQLSLMDGGEGNEVTVLIDE